MRNLIIYGFLILALSACRTTITDPGPMPTGYKHQHKPYASVPGPEAKRVGYDFSSAENAKAIAAWQNAVSDLVLKARTQGPALPPYLKLVTNLPSSAFQGSFDFVLREKLGEYGHRFSENGDVEAAQLFYTARPVKDSDDFELIIGLHEGDALASEVHGIYDVPAYGYRANVFDFGLTGFSAKKDPVLPPRESYNP